MPYEFDIVETISELGEDDEERHKQALQKLAGVLTVKSRDGWELVSTEFALERVTGSSGKPRTRRTLVSVWRRPTEELYPD